MNSISFWNSRPGKNTKMKSFLNTPVKKMTSPLFPAKPYSKRKLPPWGDLDMDGSPNKFDCNPWRADMDAKPVKKLEEDFENTMKDFQEKGRSGLRTLVERKKGRERISSIRRGASRIVSRASRDLEGFTSARYSKQQNRDAKRLRGRALGLTKLFLPPGTLAASSGKAGTGKRGRPEGPSGKYFIPGRGNVGVFEYRSWLRSQKRLARLKAQGNYEQGKPQSSPVQQARQVQQTQEMQEPMQDTEIQSTDNAQVIESEPQPMQTQAPQINSDQERLIQLQMQQRDNILLAPQFLKGELKSTGGDILSEKGRPNILQAPNAFLGQLRNLQPRDPVMLGERPITNPYGDTFTTIDPITGNAILQKRVREKWITGEAI